MCEDVIKAIVNTKESSKSAEQSKRERAVSTTKEDENEAFKKLLEKAKGAANERSE